MEFFPKQTNESLEPIRFPGEQIYYRHVVEMSDEVLCGLPVVVMPTLEESRMSLMSESLRLTEKSAPELHGVMRKALANLKRNVAYDLFQKTGDVNACTPPFEEHPLVCLEGKLLMLADPSAIQFILGHELGHCFCHSSADSASALSGLNLIVEAFPDIFKTDASVENVRRIRHYASACLQSRELTADRVGLIAVGDLEACLRLNMILTTGLPFNALKWDMDAYLEQAEFCVERMRKDGMPISSHPELCFRTWALAKFAQTDVYKAMTGKGDGSLKLTALNDEILSFYEAVPEECEEELDDDGMSEEAMIFALCACVMMAWCDGEFADEEADYLEKAFSHAVPDFRRYLKLDIATQTFDELTPYMAQESFSTKMNLFILLFLTLSADGVVNENELIILYNIGGLLGVAEVWFGLFEKLCEHDEKLELPNASLRQLIFKEVQSTGILEGMTGRFLVNLEEDEDDGADDEADAEDAGEKESPRVCTGRASFVINRTVPMESGLRSREDERNQAIEFYCRNLQRRRISHTTLAGLIRLAGLRANDREQTISLFKKAFSAHQIEVMPELSAELSMDERLTLQYEGEEPEPVKRTSNEDTPTAMIIRAISRLQASQVSGNGRSQSVRCRVEGNKRAFDLTVLNSVTEGRAERTLEFIAGKKEAVLLSTSEAGRSKRDTELSHHLEILFREMKSRIEEHGISHLYVGTSFISGMIKGYEVRAPLMLRGIELKRIDGVPAGWKVCVNESSPVIVNHAVLRMIASKRNAPYTEEMIGALDEAALQGDGALITCARELGFFLGIRGGRKIDDNGNPIEVMDEALIESRSCEIEAQSPSDVIHPYTECTPTGDVRVEDWLCYEPCAVLSFFPQSSSESLREYNEILDELKSSENHAQILGSLSSLLPPALCGELNLKPETESEQKSDSDEKVLPLVSLDPSQMEALCAGRHEKALVIDGPPGTGKSQVIVGIVLDALSRGERVAVVSDKRAALDVVAQRLSANAFDDVFALVHDVNNDKKEFYDRLNQRMNRSRECGDFCEDDSEYEALLKNYDQLLEKITSHQKSLCFSDESGALSDYARYASALRLRFESICPAKENEIYSSHIKAQACDPLLTQSFEAHHADVIQKLCDTKAQNLAGLRDILPDFVQHRSFYQNDSWWGRNADADFLEKLPEFTSFVDGWNIDAVRLQNDLKTWNDIHDNASNDLTAETRDIWLNVYRKFQSDSAMNSHDIAQPWHELSQRIKQFRSQWDRFEQPLRAGVVSSDNAEVVIDAFFKFVSEWRPYADDLLFVLSALDPNVSKDVLPLDSLIDLWTRNWIYFDAHKDIDRSQLFYMWNELLQNVIALQEAMKSIFRGFKPSYWRLKKEITAWFETHHTAMSVDKLDPTALSRIIQCAEMYIRAQKQLLPCMPAADFGLFDMCNAFSEFEQTRKSVINWYKDNHVKPYPESLSPESLDQLQNTAESFKSIQKSFLPLYAQTGLGQPAFSEELHCMGDKAKSLQKLLVRCNPCYEAAPALFCDFIGQLGSNEITPETLRFWQLCTSQAWAESHLNSMDLHDMSLLKDPHFTDELVTTFQLLENELIQRTRRKLGQKLLKQGILSEPPAPPRARRTPGQKSFEMMQAEASKKTRHAQLRTFVQTYGQAGLLDILPVWLLSPDTMTVLFPRKPVFDLVIFDEASQSTVASSLPALLRAKRWIIAGDDKQMPPTSFFASSGAPEVSETADKTNAEMFDSESLLTLARSRARHTRLSWHYRSQHDELIAFSNYAFYEGDLKTVPALYGGKSDIRLAADSPDRYLRWVQVEGASYKEGRNPVEARRVAQLLAESLDSRPEETVGIITFNINQRNEVLDAIDALCAQDASFAKRYADAQNLSIDRRPFVKSIENVQGDERDSIFFSLGHCAVPNKSGGRSVPARFGPLGQKGGERRLNVAISRARIRSTVVASFVPVELSVGNARNLGPAFFKIFVEYMYAAAHDDTVLRDAKLNEARRLVMVTNSQSTQAKDVVSLPDDLSLAAQIAQDAECAGFDVEQNVGLGPFKIPLVLTRKDTVPIAVLLNEGGTDSARDFLIHRPSILQSKGWHVVQINPVDWLVRRNEIMNDLCR